MLCPSCATDEVLFSEGRWKCLYLYCGFVFPGPSPEEITAQKKKWWELEKHASEVNAEAYAEFTRERARVGI